MCRAMFFYCKKILDAFVHLYILALDKYVYFVYNEYT